MVTVFELFYKITSEFKLCLIREIYTFIILFVNFSPFSRLLRQAGNTVGLFYYSPEPTGGLLLLLIDNILVF